MDQPPPASATKADWRRWARSLPPVDAATAAQVVAHLTALLAGVRGPVLGYVALADEVALDGVAPAELCLPRLGDHGAISIHAAGEALERHPLGFDQPSADGRVVEPSSLAAVLVPGRVFDREGYRLGRGGGHYDRLLPLLPAGIPVVGVALRSRIVDRLPREAHDRPMTHLATEDGVISTN